MFAVDFRRVSRTRMNPDGSLSPGVTSLRRTAAPPRSSTFAGRDLFDPVRPDSNRRSLSQRGPVLLAGGTGSAAEAKGILESGRLSDGGPKVRIHLPPAPSPVRTGLGTNPIGNNDEPTPRASRDSVANLQW